MLGILPEELEVNGKDYEINTDYHIALLIFEALEDPNLTDKERAYCILDLLYCNFEEIPAEDIEEAFKQAAWYLDGGREYVKPVKKEKPVLSWTQDEDMIFSGVNKLIGGGQDVRTMRMHWWTFLGLFNEMEEGPLSQIIGIRSKKNSGEKLEKWEKKFYEKNKEKVDIKRKMSDEAKEEMQNILNQLK